MDVPASPPGGACARALRSAFRQVWDCDRVLLAVIAGFAALWLPMVPRATDNPQHLATFSNDDPMIVYELVGMLRPPYGNPGNLLAHPDRRPATGRRGTLTLLLPGLR